MNPTPILSFKKGDSWHKSVTDELIWTDRLAFGERKGEEWGVCEIALLMKRDALAFSYCFPTFVNDLGFWILSAFRKEGGGSMRPRGTAVADW